MDNIIKKITSRKFIVTVVIIAAGMGAAFKSSGNSTVQIIGYVMAAAAAIAYMVIEGTIDKAAVEETVTEAIEGMKQEDA